MSLLPRTNSANNNYDKKPNIKSLPIFEIKPTKTTPYVLLDQRRNLLILRGKSSPESAQKFYEPINNVTSTFLRHGTPKLVVLFKLGYFNTSSAKCIFGLLSILKSVKSSSKNVNIKVNWYYEAYDEDMLECGKDYSEILDLNFNYIRIE